MSSSDSSIFVDYINSYSALYRVDQEAAEHFGTAPEKWLEPVLESCGLAAEQSVSGICYMEESSPDIHKSAFENAGFTVRFINPGAVAVQLTVDALSAELADSVVIIGWLPTYTPLLEEIAADGGDKPVIVSFSFSSSTADIRGNGVFDAVSGNSGFEKSFGRAIRQSKYTGSQSPTSSTAPTSLLVEMGKEIERDAGDTGIVSAGSLPSLYKRFPDFVADSNWLGFRGLLPLTRAVLAAYSGPLEIQGEGNDWKVALSNSNGSSEIQRPPVNDHGEVGTLASEIHEWLGKHLVAQPAPVPAANVASAIAEKFGEHLVDSGWLGHRSFRAFVQAASDPNISFSAVGPGYLYCPNIHQDPAETYGKDLFALADPELSAFAKELQVSHSIPYLSPEAYAVLFLAISAELEETPFSLGGTSRGARDRCPALGVAIPRSAINSVLKNILTTPHRFGEENDAPAALAAALVSAVTKICPDKPKSALDRLFASAL